MSIAYIIAYLKFKNSKPDMFVFTTRSDLDLIFLTSCAVGLFSFLFKKSFDFFKNRELTVVGGCIHGSPSICMGKVFLVLITTEEHCASLRPLALRPVLT
jgi:hypothetical protein